MRYHYDDLTRLVSHSYSSRDNLPLSTSFATIGCVTNTYDELTRPLARKYTTESGIDTLKAAYSYLDWSSETDRTSALVDGIDYTYAYEDGDLRLTDLCYTYDNAGNILEERVWNGATGNTLREKYTYDAKNQLVRHDSATQDATFTYEYDKAGNITAKKQYAYTTGTLGTPVSTKSYEYSIDTWKDLLVSYNGNPVGHDSLGNMTAYNYKTYEWNGRELKKIQGGGSTYTYKYNADGIRSSKTVNGTTTEFFLNGSQILAQKTGDDVMWFFYDSTGTRIGLVSGNTVYYYIYNLQGDVIALARASTGKIVAKYAYDAWGSCTVTNASGYTVGTRNPFRYRGYYYDTETGLYYLNSRYYSPEFGRFISADVFISTGQGFQGNNPFVYCLNNPVNMADDDGHLASTFLGALAGGLIGGLTSIAKGGSFWDGALPGAVSGAIAGATVDYVVLTGGVGVGAMVTVFLGGAGGALLGDVIYSKRTGSRFDFKKAIPHAITAGALNMAALELSWAVKGSKEAIKLSELLKPSVDDIGNAVIADGLAAAGAICNEVVDQFVDSIFYSQPNRSYPNPQGRRRQVMMCA